MCSINLGAGSVGFLVAIIAVMAMVLQHQTTVTIEQQDDDSPRDKYFNGASKEQGSWRANIALQKLKDGLHSVKVRRT